MSCTYSTSKNAAMNTVLPTPHTTQWRRHYYEHPPISQIRTWRLKNIEWLAQGNSSSRLRNQNWLSLPNLATLHIAAWSVFQKGKRSPVYPTVPHLPQEAPALLQVPFGPVITHPGLQPGAPSYLDPTVPYLFRTPHLLSSLPFFAWCTSTCPQRRTKWQLLAKPSLCPQRPAVGITGPTPSSSGSCPAQQAHRWAVIYPFIRLTPLLDYEFLKGRDLSIHSSLSPYFLAQGEHQ